MALLWMLLIGWSLSASEEGSSFILEPRVGVAYGMVRELVFYEPGYGQVPEYLSELKWDISPAILVGARGDLVTSRAGLFHLDLQSALPLPSGAMEDFDWMYSNRTDYTHYSYHEITIDSAWVLDLGWRYPFSLGQRWQILVGGGYHLDFWDWSDAIQYVRHRPGDSLILEYEDGDPLIPEEPTYKNGGNGIHYQVAYHVIFASLAARYSGSFMDFELDAAVGPVYASAEDHHFLVDTDEISRIYLDTGFGGPWVSVGGRVALRFSPFMSFVASAEYVWLSETTGNTDFYSGAGSYLGSFADQAGFQFWKLQASLGLAIEF